MHSWPGSVSESENVLGGQGRHPDWVGEPYDPGPHEDWTVMNRGPNGGCGVVVLVNNAM